MTTKAIHSEWKRHCDLFAAGAGRETLLKSAEAMKDTFNKSAALLHLGVMDNEQEREIKARWKSINAVTDAEARAHCQF